MNKLHLMILHVNCLYTHDENGRILFINEPDCQTVPAPRLFLGRTPEGNIWRFRAGLPDEIVHLLNPFVLMNHLSGKT